MKTLLVIAVCFAIFGSASLCLAQTQLVNDNFDTGTTGTYLGPNWTGCGFTTPSSGSGSYTELVYQNNQAGGAGYYTQDCVVYIGYGAFPSDQYATATLAAPVPSASPEASIQLRGNATPSTPEQYISCGWNAEDFGGPGVGDYHYRIWSLAPGGGAVNLYLSNVTPATNDVIYCQVLGTTVTMQVNGTTLATVTDTSGLTTGYPGLYYIDPNGGPPTSTDVIFDNFSAGSGPALSSLVITPSSAQVPVGSFVQFTGLATYADGTTSNLSIWSSSDTNVASVDPTGFAYASNPGTVTITGATGGDSGTASLTVTAANGYTPLVHDSFVGTGGGYLGSNWTGCGYYDGTYSKLVYQNNQAGGGGYYTQSCAVYTGFGPFPGDQYATATMVDATPANTPEASIELRGNATPSTNEQYIACGWDAQDFGGPGVGDQHYRIWSLTPGGFPNSLYLSNVTPAYNDVVWCQVMGNTVNMQVNGTTIATVTDNSGLTAGYPGLYYIDLNGDVPPPTDVIWDNFVAGSISNATLTSITVTPNPASVPLGQNVQFTATGTYTDGTSGNITNSASWSSSNTAIATVSSGTAFGASAGTVTITASSGTKNGTATLNVNPPLTPTVTFTGAPASAPLNGTFTVFATTNASIMPTITGTAGVCSVGAVTGTPANASAVVTMIAGAGTCTTTANWAPFGNYAAAGPLNQTTTATKLAATVTFTGAPASAVYNTTFAVNATTNASTMPTITGTTGVCTVGAVNGTPANSTASVTMTSGTGTCTLTATWAADSNYSAPAPQTQRTTATKATSTITINSNTPNPSTLQQGVSVSFSAGGVGAGPTGSVTVSASTRESCTASLNSAHNGSCSITFSSTGSRTISARYAGDNNFSSSTSGSVNQTVNSPAVSLSPTSLNFGTVNRGSSVTLAETITNTGAGALINLSWTINSNNGSQFKVSSTTCSSTLSPGSNCVLNITFKPNSTGLQFGTLRLTDNAPNSPQNVPLSGTGR